MVLGIWVAILPYLGFPQSWKNILFLLTGLGLAYFGYILYKEWKGDREETFDNFSENKDFGGESMVEEEIAVIGPIEEQE